MPRGIKKSNGGLDAPSRVEPKPNDDGGGTQSGDNLASGGNPQPEIRTEPVVETLAGIELIDPAGVSDATGSGEPRRRGRPRGPSGSKKVPADLTKFDGVILAAHLVVAAMMDAPELEISKEDSEDFARVTKNLLAEYSTSVSPKALAWTEFVMTVGRIEI